MTNREIRIAITAAGIKHWEVAQELGMHEVTFCRKLRFELDQEERQIILNAIDRLRKKND